MKAKFRVWEHDVKYMNDQVRITYNPFGSNKIFVEATECFGWKEVDEKYLMQSTGLTDENTEEVFQDDIIYDDHYDEYGIVKFYEGRFVIEWQENHVEDLFERIDLLEVVGNIHENPGLLERDDKCM
ncbi:YopX family protein [Macrococcoides canis]|uniref:YopX family protein n=1 Tax=Macrococcoides canis TaxID=1855823 RepID=UPI00165D7800|nr:YopX family protein [Macrococcus canis]QNR07795.1 hypothetical protein GL258_05830 [Macrococcus canis]